VSSLLDILHRRDGTARHDELPPPAAEDAAPPVELRLAIDNGPAEPVADLAVEPQPEPRTELPPASEATRVLAARQVEGRSRRSTAFLAAGLAVIVLGAGLATWLLNETGEFSPTDDSLFTTPPPAAAAIERPVAVAPPDGADEAPRPVADEPRDVVPDPETAWFDTPATEDPAAGYDEPAAEPIRITRGTTTNPLFATLSAAWTAFQAADYARAEALYREVRAADPGNVDALLGLGALAMRGNRTDEAREHYQAVLLAEPRNAAAISALSTLPSAGTRVADESALKGYLREQPGAAHLHFALGLQYVGQGRWADAQTAFFEAVRHEPANADYAYNLAVSLDQLGQSGPAAAYYQRALELATASSLFDPGAAAERLATLRPATP